MLLSSVGTSHRFSIRFCAVDRRSAHENSMPINRFLAPEWNRSSGPMLNEWVEFVFKSDRSRSLPQEPVLVDISISTAAIPVIPYGLLCRVLC
jgi:hypothetical protein